MDNKEAALIFRDIADILEIKNENIFRVRAYRQAASRIEALGRQLSEMYKEDPSSISDVPGIGKDLFGKIEEMVTTGHLEFYSRLVKEFPAGFLDLLNLPGLGPKKLRKLRDVLGVKNIDELEKACLSGKIAGIEGMGEITQRKIIAEISRFKKNEGRMLAPLAEELADRIILHLSSDSNFKKIEKAGSLRRGAETVGDIDILVWAKDPLRAARRLVSFPGAERVLSKGPSKCSIEAEGAHQVDMRLVEKKCFGAALLYFTGSKQHNIKIRQLAKKKNYKLNEYGVFSISPSGREKFLAGKTEKEVYEQLSMQWVPPELREDRGEVEASLKGRLPKDLLELGDIRGDLHLHTVDSDGMMTLEGLIEAALEKGYSYMAVTNHSKLVRIANGMDEKRLLKHVEHIRKISRKYKKIKVLAGVEVDILRDGTLDLEDAALKELDIVIAAVHSNFSADRNSQTERLIRAIDNRYVNILAHPSGRLITKRDPLDFDKRKVFLRASQNNVVLEINTHGERVDLNDIDCMLAKELGAKFAVNTDSHQKRHMDGMKLGVSTARRAWLEKKDVVNTYSFEELRKVLKR